MSKRAAADKQGQPASKRPSPNPPTAVTRRQRSVALLAGALPRNAARSAVSSVPGELLRRICDLAAPGYGRLSPCIPSEHYRGRCPCDVALATAALLTVDDVDGWTGDHWHGTGDLRDISWLGCCYHSAMHAAVACGAVELAGRLGRFDRRLVRLRTWTGMEPIHQAVWGDDAPMVAALLEAGANVNALMGPDAEGEAALVRLQTPLDLAASFGHAEVARELLRWGGCAGDAGADCEHWAAELRASRREPLFSVGLEQARAMVAAAVLPR